MSDKAAPWTPPKELSADCLNTATEELFRDLYRQQRGDMPEGDIQQVLRIIDKATREARHLLDVFVAERDVRRRKAALENQKRALRDAEAVFNGLVNEGQAD